MDKGELQVTVKTFMEESLSVLVCACYVDAMIRRASDVVRSHQSWWRRLAARPVPPYPLIDEIVGYVKLASVLPMERVIGVDARIFARYDDCKSLADQIRQTQPAHTVHKEAK